MFSHVYTVDQTFSPDIFPYEQVFDCFATRLPTRLVQAGKSNQSETSHIIISSSNTQKAFCALTLSNVWSNIVCSFSHQMFCVTNTLLDKNVWSFSQSIRSDAMSSFSTGVNTTGYFIVCVWNFMTFKWGLFTFLAARKFRKMYFDSDPQSRGLVQST